MPQATKFPVALRPASVEVLLSTDQDRARGESQGWDIVTGVGVTAIAVAAARAVETSRHDGLINDPYASFLVAEAGAEASMPTSADDPAMQGGDLWPGITSYMAIRTAVFDDYSRSAVESGVTQVVLLAAGLDSRAYRLEWPQGLTLYEIDQPAVLDFKLGALEREGVSPACEHRPVRVDLREDWPAALRGAGFDPAAPTAWLAEGLLPYLPAEAERQLFKEIHRLSGPGSRIAVEQIGDMDVVLNDPMMNDASALGVDVRELLHTDERQPSAQWLEQQGWQTRDISPHEASEHYGRELLMSVPLTGSVVYTLGELP
jgi:methyltransferase (TIGR00027 family)